MRHNKMKTWSLEIWKVDNKNHLVLLTTASPEQFYICHSIHSISETSQGASGIKAYCPSWNILHRLMTEYCIISHSFSPESRLCTYHIVLPPAEPMQSDDIVQPLMHEMLAHLRPQSIITDCKTSYCMWCAHCELWTRPRPRLLPWICCWGAALGWSVTGTWDWLSRFDVTDHVWTRDPGAWQLGSLADN